MKFEVDKEMVEPIIREQIAAAVVAQLGDTEELIRRMVNVVLSKKVDSDGNVSNYSSANKFTLIESLAGKAIRSAAKEALEQIIREQKPAIEKAVRDHLQRAPKRTASAIVNSFCSNAESKYSMKINFEVSES